VAKTLPLHPFPAQYTALPTEALLVDIYDLVRLLSRSRASLERDLAAGRLIAPIRLFGSRRWRYAELVSWTEAGCPLRREWEARRRQEGGGR
jgi:hypothetical protein